MSDQTLNESKRYLNKQNIHQLNPPLLGIDYGKKNVGLAVTDKNGIVATPLKTIRIKENNLTELGNEIEQITKTYGIQQIILGIPQEFEKTHTQTTKNVLDFMYKLIELTKCDIFLYDESYSTTNSYSLMRSQGKSQKKSRKKIDKIASAYFLQELLDFKNTEDEK